MPSLFTVLTEGEIIPLARFSRERGLELRFIEYMPLDAENHWQATDVLDGEAIRRILEAEFGRLSPSIAHTPASPPATSNSPTVAAASASFNRSRNRSAAPCDRLRLTAEGQIRNCLFSTAEWDARAILRRRAGSSPTPEDDDELADLIRNCIEAKAPAHGINTVEFVRPDRAMYQIGG